MPATFAPAMENDIADRTPFAPECGLSIEDEAASEQRR
jgi:hypothetical protein